MVEISTTYQGQLRCSAVHGPSGNTLLTDAPKDNMGKGEAFSPTDLVATAVGRVWLADEPGDDALVSWRTGTGRHHVVGGAPPVGADLTEPTLEDAYLLMLGPDAHRVHSPS